MPTELKTVKKEREVWLDVARGLCAIFVVLSHVPSTPLIYKMFYAPIMIPPFFFVSGYLSKNYNGSVGKFFYNRVLKLLIVRLIIVAELTLMSVKVIWRCLTSPSYLLNTLLDIIINTFMGHRAWFFSCLILISVCFIIINKLCRDKIPAMLTVSVILAAVGILVSERGTVRAWSWDTALVCQLFFVIGYCVKKKQLLSGDKIKVWHCLISAIVYFGVEIIFAVIFGAENITITVANNDWGIIAITAVIIFTGNVFLICLAKKLPPLRFLTYIGKHSFLYFALGGQVMLYCLQGVQILYNLTGFSPLNNIYITCIPVTLIACVIMLIPCWLSDKFCPALNGRINLPPLNGKNRKGSSDEKVDEHKEEAVEISTENPENKQTEVPDKKDE